jgi:hypothetical protein
VERIKEEALLAKRRSQDLGHGGDQIPVLFGEREGDEILGHPRLRHVRGCSC